MSATCRSLPSAEIRPLRLSTLSPVHIGCGEDYEPGNFVIHDGLLHVLDPAVLALELSETEFRQLLTLSSRRQPIAALQRFFSTSAARFAEMAVRQVAVDRALAREYADKAGRPTQQGSADDDAVFNQFQIARTAFRPLDGSPYLPGSSLKGSIRTAWLNRLLLARHAMHDNRENSAAARLEQELLGNRDRSFTDDPFRKLAIADAHIDDDELPPPTQVLYALSRKKSADGADPKTPGGVTVFLETIPEALPAAFHGEVRLLPDAKIAWPALCDACNDFYRSRLVAELRHPVLGALLEPAWRRLIGGLLDGPLQALIAARQGFLLRVGRHSGAESLTLDGVRRIKIRLPGGYGKPRFEFRPQTSQQRLAGHDRAGSGGLLPFGWLWVDASDDAHRHLADELRQRLGERSRALRDTHQDRLLRQEEKQAQRAARAAEMARQKQIQAAAERAAVAAAAERQEQFARMTPNQRRIEAFADHCRTRVAQLRGQKENPHAQTHSQARALARDAAGWLPAERQAAAEAIEHWLPQVVRIDLKEERKKLQLAALRTP